MHARSPPSETGPADAAARRPVRRGAPAAGPTPPSATGRNPAAPLRDVMNPPPDLLRPLEEIRRVTGRSALTNLAEAVLAELGHPHFTLPTEDTDEGLLTREALAAYRVAVTREAPFQDILEPVHQAQLTGLKHKQRTGQFFTPWPLAQMMAKVHLTGWTPGRWGHPGADASSGW